MNLSVIIPTYNRSLLLDHTLRSLALQQFPKDQFEVIVADDGSSDDTLEVVERYATVLNMGYVFQEDKGFRPASARNKAIRIAKGEVCVFIDSGILLHEGCLAAHWNMHLSSPGAITTLGYVYGFEFTHDIGKNILFEKMILSQQPTQTIAFFKEQGCCMDVREPIYRKYNYQIHELPAPWIFYWTCHVAVRTADLLAMEMFDEAYDGRWGCEDNDLGLRLQLRGIKFIICHEAEAIHCPHDQNGMSKIIQGQANCVYFHEKFNLPSTKLFLQNYHDEEKNEFADINEMLAREQFIAG